MINRDAPAEWRTGTRVAIAEHDVRERETDGPQEGTIHEEELIVIGAREGDLVPAVERGGEDVISQCVERGGSSRAAGRHRAGSKRQLPHSRAPFRQT